MERLLAACLAGVFALPVSAAVLVTGYGSAGSEDAARAAAREDLAVRLQHAVASRLRTGSARSALVEEREFPLIGIEIASAGARGGHVRFEARLTDASLAAYQREAARLAERLRKLEPGRVAEGFAWLDQQRRVAAVLKAFSKAPAEVAADEAALGRLAAKSLAPTDPTGAAKAVKSALDRANLSVSRVVAPVRSGSSEVTALSGAIADELRAALRPRVDRGGYTLDGTYDAGDGKILLKLFLLDASFNTERAFVFVLKGASESGSARSRGLAQALSRGLVRVDLPEGGAADAMGVDVRTEKGRRGLYYRPGDRDQLFVKLDRPGYYYVVGHVEKGSTRLSYLMEIGAPSSASRFVRRVDAGAENQWEAVGEFTVEPPLGLEAVQVFATSESPERALPPARLDPSRNLYLIGTDPSEAVKRTRGLVMVNMGDPGGKKPGAIAARPVVGEAVLQFMTLQ